MKINSNTFMFVATILAVPISLAFPKEEGNFNPFQRVNVIDSSIVVTFPDHGIRYALKLNDKNIGISQYNQIMKLRQNDTFNI